jgi:alpha-L-rhamnosidase
MPHMQIDLSVCIIALALSCLPSACSVVATTAGPSLTPEAIAIDGEVNGIVIDTQYPRFSWKLSPEDPGLRGLSQSSYRIQVATSTARFPSGQADLWDSGKVQTSKRKSAKFMVSIWRQV